MAIMVTKVTKKGIVKKVVNKKVVIGLAVSAGILLVLTVVSVLVNVADRKTVPGEVEKVIEVE